MMASDEERSIHYSNMMAKQGYFVRPSEIHKIPKDELLRMILPPGGSVSGSGSSTAAIWGPSAARSSLTLTITRAQREARAAASGR